MSEIETRQSALVQLARLIEHDITQRGLVEGDAYLTADQVAQKFDVHLRQAGRAMEWLARRDVLLRRRGAGTFIGSAVSETDAEDMRCVHVLIASHRMRGGLATHYLAVGADDLVGAPNVQFNMLPGHHDDRYAQRVIDKALDDHTLAGLVLVGCPRSVQEVVCQRGVPAIVFGGVYPNTEQLASIDIDHAESGRLQAGVLLERGHRRIGLLTRESWLPGDNLFVDGVNDALASSNMMHGSLTIRSFAWEPVAFQDGARQLLGGDERPTGLICRDRFAVESVARVASGLGLNVPGDLDLVYDATDGRARLDTPLPYVRAQTEMPDQVRLVAEGLKRVIDGATLAERHVVVPVNLVSE